MFMADDCGGTEVRITVCFGAAGKRIAGLCERVVLTSLRFLYILRVRRATAVIRTRRVVRERREVRRVCDARVDADALRDVLTADVLTLRTGACLLDLRATDLAPAALLASDLLFVLRIILGFMVLTLLIVIGLLILRTVFVILVVPPKWLDSSCGYPFSL
jgi:hypothetical protein